MPYTSYTYHTYDTALHLAPYLDNLGHQLLLLAALPSAAPPPEGGVTRPWLLLGVVHDKYSMHKTARPPSRALLGRAWRLSLIWSRVLLRCLHSDQKLQ